MRFSRRIQSCGEVIIVKPNRESSPLKSAGHEVRLAELLVTTPKSLVTTQHNARGRNELYAGGGLTSSDAVSWPDARSTGTNVADGTIAPLRAPQVIA